MYDLVYRLLEQNLHLARTRRLAETSLWTVQLVFMTRRRGGGRISPRMLHYIRISNCVYQPSGESLTKLLPLETS